MTRIPIHTASPYDVIVEDGCLSRVGYYVRALHEPCQVMIVTDTHVGPLYAQLVQEQLEVQGFTVCVHTFPAGEASKEPNQLLAIINDLAVRHFTRSDLLIALGGGVVGDMGGFAAATYMRGIRYVQIPTTLLAAVDSSVGGKTAVNLPMGKNLWGAFKQPLVVICDPCTLETLPDAEWVNGCGEIIKYGFLDVPGLLEHLEAKPLLTNRHFADEVISRCIQAKARIVSEDEREMGVRALLNLGHTMGHAIEQHTGYAVPHGKAVAIGLMMMLTASARRGTIDSHVVRRTERILEIHQLPTITNIPLSTLMEYASHDKKSKGSAITVVVPTAFGHAQLETMTFTALSDFLAQ